MKRPYRSRGCVKCCNSHITQLWRHLIWAKHWLPHHFSLALSEEIEVRVVKQLIHRFELAPDDALDETWPWPVRLRAFGGLEIYLQGERYTSNSKSHYRVLQLLKVIIALAGTTCRLKRQRNIYGRTPTVTRRSAIYARRYIVYANYLGATTRFLCRTTKSALTSTSAGSTHGPLMLQVACTIRVMRRWHNENQHAICIEDIC